jgi:hypothetical protein
MLIIVKSIMKNWEGGGGLEGISIFRKYFLQPKIPSDLFVHSNIVVAFHQLPINYFYHLATITS